MNGDANLTVDDVRFDALSESYKHMDGRINMIHHELTDQKTWRMEIGSDVASLKTMIEAFSDHQKLNAPSKTSWVAAAVLAVTVIGGINAFVQQEQAAMKEIEALKNSHLIREVDMLRGYSDLAVSKANAHTLEAGARAVAIGRLEYAEETFKGRLDHIEDLQAENQKVGHENSKSIASLIASYNSLTGYLKETGLKLFGSIQ